MIQLHSELGGQDMKGFCCVLFLVFSLSFFEKGFLCVTLAGLELKRKVCATRPGSFAPTPD